jgi:chromosome segregation ATPase
MVLTVQNIHATADRIAAEGHLPTLAKVRSALGSGSFTTISEAMKSWKAAQQAAVAPIREAAPAAVIERMGELAAEVWGVAIGMANDRLASEREALEVARQEMEQAKKEAAELADQVAADLDAARVQIDSQAESLKQAEAQAAQLAAAQVATHTAQAALAEAQKRADGLAALLEQERAATREAQAKAEKALADAAWLAGKLEALEDKSTCQSV